MIEKLSERIKSAGLDVDKLNSIKAELDAISGPQAFDLKMRLANSFFKAKRAANEVSVKSILDGCGLSNPDERPLYQYRLDSAGYDRLRDFLREKGRRGFAAVSWEIPALFVLWGSHWFQRAYRGGVRKWEDIGEALGVPFNGDDGRRLVREGLTVWKRPAVKREYNQWLMTLAVEGGFPAGILEDAQGWLSKYLLRVIAQLLEQDTIESDVAFMVAAKEADYISPTYQQDIFFALAADLAATIANFRRRAEQSDRPRGASTSAWLDVIEPGWRDKLPIPTGVAGAAKLVDGLMETSTVGLSGDRSVGCERLIQLRGGIWRFAVRLGLDGVAKGAILNSLGGRTERVRVFPAGALARYAHGEFAMLEPPSKAEDEWRMRPSRADAVLTGIPMSTPISVELRCDSKPVGQSVWPKGESVRGDVAIFGGDLLSDALSEELSLIGVGSGHYKPKTLAVAVPEDWTVTIEAPEQSAERLESKLEDGRALWRVQGKATVRSAEGDVFRVVSDSTSSRRDELRLSGARPKRIDCEEADVELFAGAPFIKVIEGARVREAGSPEVRWRCAGERPWRSLPVALGRIEIAWFDSEANFIRDRRRAFVLPAGADLELRRERDRTVYAPTGLEVAAFSFPSDDLAIERHEGEVAVRFERHYGRRAPMAIKIGAGRPVNVSAPFLVGAGIATWSGVRIFGGKLSISAAKLSLAELSDCVAFAEGRHGLAARLLDRDRREIKGASARWTFDEEMPLRDVAEELSSMMALFGDIDVFAELSLQDDSAYWHVQQFEMSLDPRAGQLAMVDGFSRDEVVELFGRPVDEPWHERHLGSWTFADRMERRLPQFPDDLVGSWIIFGRRGSTIVSRPRVKGFAIKTEIAEGLPAAAMVVNHFERQQAIEARLKLIEEASPDAEDDITWLVDLCAELQGLPPASFDALHLLPLYPVTAARVALRAATEAKRRAVLAVENGLTFAWFLIPVEAWRRAAEIEQTQCVEQLRKAGLPDAEKWGQRALADAIKSTAAIEPLLACPLAAATQVFADAMPARRKLDEAANDHICRFGDKVSDLGSEDSAFRSLFPGKMPKDFERFSLVHLETLDAPCAAAHIVAIGAEVSPRVIRLIKLHKRMDPTFFAEAFVSRLVSLLNG
ncbi:STY4851/ECs_5259 family protein [Rhodoblastus sp.]|uniref:STY4851/ECs_5259 family protein n=1 Tax=Rhodoblastus sp. TaxID=1962975 RepID=UPI003F9D06AE